MASGEATATKKQSLYILSEFHPTSLEHAKSKFHCISYGTPEANNWRQKAQAILIKDYAITAADLEQAPQLKVIGKQGVGVDQIDIDACRKAGVKVINTPGINASAVAEMTLALALSVSKKIPNLCSRMINEGEIIRKETVRGLLLSGKILGVVGMGHIGQAVARMFSGAFGCTVVAYDSHIPWQKDENGSEIPPKGWTSISHQRVETLEELLTCSDIVTLHVPLTQETKGLISRRELHMMKKTAILLNTARGGIVDEDDLNGALHDGQIWGAGFDCHVQEPPSREQYRQLWDHETFVGTPHTATATDETQIATINAAIDGVWALLNEPVLGA